MPGQPTYPPFDADTARTKVRLAEDAWNSRDPERVVQVYTADTLWRNRAAFPSGREQVREFLQRKWARELDDRLIRELWAGPTARGCARPRRLSGAADQRRQHVGIPGEVQPRRCVIEPIALAQVRARRMDAEQLPRRGRCTIVEAPSHDR